MRMNPVHVIMVFLSQQLRELLCLVTWSMIETITMTLCKGQEKFMDLFGQQQHWNHSNLHVSQKEKKFRCWDTRPQLFLVHGSTLQIMVKDLDLTLTVWPASGPSWIATVRAVAEKWRSIMLDTNCAVWKRSFTSAEVRSSNLSAGLIGVSSTSRHAASRVQQWRLIFIRLLDIMAQEFHIQAIDLHVFLVDDVDIDSGRIRPGNTGFLLTKAMERLLL